MQQSNQKQASLLPDTALRVQVLVPYPVAHVYDYIVPEGMVLSVGDYVKVSLGKKDTVGVVWSLAEDKKLDPARLKSVQQKYDCPPMPKIQRQFIEWVARYTMADMGSVLKMSVSVPDVFQPPKPPQAYILPDTLPDTLPDKISVPRQKILDFLSDAVPRRAAEIVRQVGCSASVIRAMAVAGQLKSVPLLIPAPCRITEVPKNTLVFSESQRQAADSLIQLVAAKKYDAALLDGVTGAGKTEVYFEAVAEALRQGRQVLILLPEISLSAQFLDRFNRRFGIAPAIWHSEVSQAKRRRTWLGVAEGKTKVIVGARSALFLPYVDLGLVIVDEEHDASYKQEEGVLYHARDMAIVRASLGNIPVVLVSATPALETMHNVKQEKYQYLHLPSRHAGAAMPEMHVIDLKATPTGRAYQR